MLAFGVQSLAWPLFPGRDAQTYLMYYLDMWSGARLPSADAPPYPAGIAFHRLLPRCGWKPLAEAALGVLYVRAILGVYCVGSFWSRHRLASALALLAIPGYGALYHSVSSDAPFAFGLVAWAVLIVATFAVPTSRKFVPHGVVLFALVLIRPSGLSFCRSSPLSVLSGGADEQRLRMQDSTLPRPSSSSSLRRIQPGSVRGLHVARWSGVLSALSLDRDR